MWAETKAPMAKKAARQKKVEGIEDIILGRILMVLGLVENWIKNEKNWRAIGLLLWPKNWWKNEWCQMPSKIKYSKFNGQIFYIFKIGKLYLNKIKKFKI
jgi:hypothetical protein